MAAVHSSEGKPPDVKKQVTWWSRTNIVLVVIAVILLVAIGVFASLNKKAEPTAGEYFDTSTPATASFELQVNYTPNCEGKENCDPNKPNFDDLKLFVFDHSGKQVRVVRADDGGAYKASLPEGEYILLVPKTFEDRNSLPQETVVLKNGTVYQLQVDYGREQ